MSNPTPPAPKPLRENWLTARRGRECQWENISRLSDYQLQEILTWAKEQMSMIFQLQDLGLGPDDPQFSHQIDKLYDTIRNAMTRQDLIVGFLMGALAEAQELAKDRQKDFNLELSRLTEPDIF